MVIICNCVNGHGCKWLIRSVIVHNDRPKPPMQTRKHTCGHASTNCMKIQ